MKLVKIVVILALAYAGFLFYQNKVAVNHPLVGNWVSLEKESMKEFYKIGVTESQEKFLRSWVGSVTMKISKTHFERTIDGVTTKESYEIISEKNDCYTIKTDDSDSSKSCIVGDLLYVQVIEPGFENANIVFARF